MNHMEVDLMQERQERRLADTNLLQLSNEREKLVGTADKA